jgi:hypothetical protein
MSMLQITASRGTSAKKIKQCLPCLEDARWFTGNNHAGHVTLLILTTDDLEFGMLTSKLLELWDQDLFDECVYDEGLQQFRVRRKWWMRWILALLELLLPLDNQDEEQHASIPAQ